MPGQPAHLQSFMIPYGRLSTPSRLLLIKLLRVKETTYFPCQQHSTPLLSTKKLLYRLIVSVWPDSVPPPVEFDIFSKRKTKQTL